MAGQTSLLSSPLHRLPTLWSLYRPLLRAASAAPLDPPHRQTLRDYVRQEFKRWRKLQNVQRVRLKWTEAEQLLHSLQTSHNSATDLSALRTLASRLSARRRRPAPARPAPRPPRKPRLTPSILRATSFHPPMSRLRPQPIGTSMMIFNRRRASQKRYDLLEKAKEYVEMARAEARFETGLGTGGAAREARWGGEWEGWIREARTKESKEQQRNEMRIPAELQLKAREANRRRERLRASRAQDAKGRGEASPPGP
ncbi:hypothetical protein JCM1841_006042 [Sporobolomyces salmonicolor]